MLKEKHFIVFKSKRKNSQYKSFTLDFNGLLDALVYIKDIRHLGFYNPQIRLFPDFPLNQGGIWYTVDCPYYYIEANQIIRVIYQFLENETDKLKAEILYTIYARSEQNFFKLLQDYKNENLKKFSYYEKWLQTKDYNKYHHLV